MAQELTLEMASRFAGIALGHVTREWPNKMDHVMGGAGDVRGPRELHPIFYGSFDWHSCVHGWWLLARVRRLFPAVAQAGEIVRVFDAHLTRQNVEGEFRYLKRAESRGFERPYGWAWLLMLAAEFSRDHSREGRRWSEMIGPLAREFAERFIAFLPKAIYPVRSGVHNNSAFATALAMEYAETLGDEVLLALLKSAAVNWYTGDVDCQAWEPSLDDFLSPVLVEAECMRRILPTGDFRKWFGRLLPRVSEREPRTLFTPARVSDRSDGKIAHLDGLNLSRAWCWRGIADAVEDESVRAAAREAAEVHLEASLSHVAGDYMGEHWLATFAMLALSY